MHLAVQYISPRRGQRYQSDAENHYLLSRHFSLQQRTHTDIFTPKEYWILKYTTSITGLVNLATYTSDTDKYTT